MIVHSLGVAGIGDMPVPAERVFLRIARRWYDGFETLGSNKTPPRALDELALAAVLLFCEHGEGFTEVAQLQAKANVILAEKRIVPWVDRLPWRLTQGCGLGELDDNLYHHNSSLRIWAMELGWMARPWLDRDTALPRLLKNVADTLVGVQMAWGLAGTLFPEPEEFYAAAESFQPEDFEDQYAERIARFKTAGLTTAQAPFWKTEATCRRLIIEATLC